MTKLAAKELQITDTFLLQKEKAIELRTSTAEQRIAKLKRLEAEVLAQRQDLYKALYTDLHKPESEAELGEVMPVIGEIHHAIGHLKKWMKTQHVAASKTMLGTEATLRYEPKGVCLVISPWNYPVILSLGPVVSAIAAGNTFILKPSEVAPASARVLAEIIGKIFQRAEGAVFEGDVAVATELLSLPFDHMFFTGSPAVGKVVMAAAARHLSSVTLELGGKSPVIVDETADLKKTAKSVMWGKFLNSGQTCIAPDYLYVHEQVLPEFLELAKKAIEGFYGSDVQRSLDYCRMVNQHHFSRVKGLMEDASKKGAKIETGGLSDEADLFLAPTLMTQVTEDSLIRQEEIFGPVLPILTYRDLEDPIRHINENPKPLAVYVYSNSSENIERILSRTSSGGACVNTAVLQFSHRNLPFGGVNNSGMGSSHGHFGFKAFSHERAVLRDRHSVISRLFPPYTPQVKRLIKLVAKYFV